MPRATIVHRILRPSGPYFGTFLLYSPSALSKGFRVVQGMKAIERWRHGHFDDDYETTEISGHEADPDTDGMNNLLKYAQNLDPNDGSDVRTGLEAETSAGATALRFRKHKDAPDVNYQIQQTDDLSAPNW